VLRDILEQSRTIKLMLSKALPISAIPSAMPVRVCSSKAKTEA